MNTKEKFALLFSNPVRFFKLAGGVALVRIKGLINFKGNRFSTDLEVKTLQKLASLAKVGIVEIGVLDGLTTAEMGKVAQVPIYGIDPIIPDSMNRRLIGHENIIKRNMSFYSNFHFIKDFSYNAVRGWSKDFDFIFIDGDHRYEAVKKDFEDWYPLLKSGGFAAFHDSAPVLSLPNSFKGWPGPVQLVAELKNDPRVEFLETQDSLSVFKKN